MEKIKVMLVSDIELPVIMLEKIRMEQEIEVVAISYSWENFLDQLIKCQPDIVFVHLPMVKNQYGADTIKMVNSSKILKKPFFVVVSISNNIHVLDNSMDADVFYYFLNKDNLDTMFRKIKSLYQFKFVRVLRNNNSEPVLTYNIEKKVTDIIHDLGIPANLLGYKYIREAIIICLFEESSRINITKDIYPQIALKYDTTPSRVERSIRNAIETAWSRGNIKLLESIFGYTVGIDKDRPTNFEFVALIADKIRLEFAS